MTKLSVIILSYTKSLSIFEMTKRCVESLRVSEQSNENIQIEIIIIESNKNYNQENFIYGSNIKIIVPQENFNFHRFLNIGIKASSGDFVALCNNDLIFYKNWFTEIIKINKRYPNIKSFSPNEPSPLVNSKITFETGYKIRSIVKGWCIVFDKNLINTIGYLDETFDFYFADNDYAMTLRMYNIRHALVLNSFVEHLGKQTVPHLKEGAAIDKSFLDKYIIPKYLRKANYQYVLGSERNLSGFLKFHNKWGSPNLIHRKGKVADILIKYRLGYFVRFFLRIN